MNRRLLSGIGAAVCAAAVFAGCGGGGGGLTTAPIPPTKLATPTSVPSLAAKPGTASFTFVLPYQRTQSAKRGTKFVSPSTQSVNVTLLTVNGTAPSSSVTNTVNIGATQPNCTSNGSGVSCNLTIDAPAGADTFSVTAYDGFSGGGNILGSTTVPSTLISANAANRITLTLSGTVASIALFTPLTCGECGAPTIYAPGAGTPTQALLIAVAFDAAGNQIVLPGTYSQPITIAVVSSSPLGAIKLAVNNGVPANSVQVNGPTDQVFAVGQPVAGNGTAYFSATSTAGPAPQQVSFNFVGTPPTPPTSPISFSYYAVPTPTPAPTPTPFVLPTGATPSPTPTPSPVPTAPPIVPPTPIPTSLLNAANTFNMFPGSSAIYVVVTDTINPSGLSYTLNGVFCSPGSSTSLIDSIALTSGIPTAFNSGATLQILPTSNAANHGSCTVTVTDSSSATNQIILNVFSISGTVQ